MVVWKLRTEQTREKKKKKTTYSWRWISCQNSYSFMKTQHHHHPHHHHHHWTLSLSGHVGVSFIQFNSFVFDSLITLQLSRLQMKKINANNKIKGSTEKWVVLVICNMSFSLCEHSQRNKNLELMDCGDLCKKSASKSNIIAYITTYCMFLSNTCNAHTLTLKEGKTHIHHTHTQEPS